MDIYADQLGPWRSQASGDPLLGSAMPRKGSTEPGGAVPSPSIPLRTSGGPIWSGSTLQLTQRQKAQMLSIRLRWITTWISIVLTSAITHASFAGTSAYIGGYLQFSMSMTILVLAGFATIAWPNDRREILADCRTPLLTILGGGTSTALLAALTRSLQGPTSTDVNNLFAQLFVNSLPIVFLTTVVIPALLYTRMIISHRALHRSSMDNEELVAIYTRQDGLQR